MTFADVIFTALQQLRENKLRSFFTLLGIIVSVTFLVAVVAIIQGMNAYVSDNLAGAIVGQNAFQVRRTPIQIGLFDDETMRRIQKRPRITGEPDTLMSSQGLPPLPPLIVPAPLPPVVMSDAPVPGGFSSPRRPEVAMTSQRVPPSSQGMGLGIMSQPVPGQRIKIVIGG